MQVVDFLKSVALFEGLSEQSLDQLSKALSPHQIGVGTNLFYAGDPGDSLYIVAQGEVEVYLTDKDTGVDIALKRFHAGDYFGEMSLISQEPRSASARAVTDSNLLSLTLDNFLKLVEKIPSVSLALSRELANRIRKLNAERGVPFVDLSRYGFDEEAYGAIPTRLLTTHQAIPLRISGETLTVGMVSPSNLVALDDLRRGSGGLNLEALAVSEGDYQRYLKRFGKTMKVEEDGARVRRSTGGKVAFLSADKDRGVGGEASGEEVVKALNLILGEAIDMGASDVHLEPTPNGMDVRFRLDGRLVRRPHKLSRGFCAPIVSRVKILAEMDISERRIPQDGGIGLQKDGNRMDLRVSTIPTSHGEKLVMRILDPGILTKGLERIILASRVCQSIKDVVAEPFGLILVSGPTGSGKTTTLYGLLNELDRDAKNIVTVEDPIEYGIEDVTQTQVKPGIGLDFSDMIRGLLRQDPDVILVGEVRDHQTAQAAIDASLTGHMVLSSVHANDAPGALVRLLDLNVEPFLVANAVLGIVNQRLVRRVCPGCKGEVEYDPATQARLRIALGEKLAMATGFEGRGCEMCGTSGYKGRVAIVEYLRMNDRLREVLLEESHVKELRSIALETGMVPLSSYGAFLVKSGVTTAAEALRVLSHSE